MAVDWRVLLCMCWLPTLPYASVSHMNDYNFSILQILHAISFILFLILSLSSALPTAPSFFSFHQFGCVYCTTPWQTSDTNPPRQPFAWSRIVFDEKQTISRTNYPRNIFDYSIYIQYVWIIDACIICCACAALCDGNWCWINSKSKRE